MRQVRLECYLRQQLRLVLAPHCREVVSMRASRMGVCDWTHEGTLIRVRRRVLVTAIASGEARSRLMGEPVRP